VNAPDVDVLVIGGNPGGCAAAISAARSGCQVVLLEPTPTLGGMNANGTFGFDCATPQALSGIAEEVGQRIRAHYAAIGLHDPLFDKREDLVWESHVAAKVWRELAAETAGLRVITRAVAVGVQAENGRITSVTWTESADRMGNVAPGSPEQHVRARVVIDASYEVDVAAWAGAPFRLGRESRSPREPHAGRIYFSNLHGEPAQGYLAHSILPGSSGEGDDAVMAYALRLHCRIYEDPSPTARHRLREPPPGYDPGRYEWSPVGTTPDGKPAYFNTLYVLVNGKYLLNRMVRGNNLSGPCRDYVLAHPRDRKAIRQLFIAHALGYLYFVQNEGGMPQLGLADDEFQDNGLLPYQLYVREARRIEGVTTLDESDVNPFLSGDGLRPPPRQDAVAIGDWTYESQGCADSVPPGYPYPDGYIIGRATRTAYQIPFGCLLPQGVDNLLVCGGISATHVAFGATRCEAARIQLGIAAGIASALSVARGCRPHDVAVEDIQREIIGRAGKLVYFSDVESTHVHFAAIQWAALRGWLPADEDLALRPDESIRWSDFAELVVRAMRLPLSVTGVHFEQVAPRHPAFRYLETLYDLGSRSGVDLFGVRRLADEDPMKEFLRLFPKHKLLTLNPRQAVGAQEADRFLRGIGKCLGLDTSAWSVPTNMSLSRGAACNVVQRLGDS